MVSIIAPRGLDCAASNCTISALFPGELQHIRHNFPEGSKIPLSMALTSMPEHDSMSEPMQTCHLSDLSFRFSHYASCGNYRLENSHTALELSIRFVRSVESRW